MAFELFPDQAVDVRALRVLFRSWRATCYQLPTGGGKTVVAGYIAQQLRANGFKILILVHRKELVRQFVNTLRINGLNDDIGIICPGFTPTPWAPIQVGMVFSWVRRRPNFQPDVIFIDEAHHVRAKSWSTVLDWYPDAKLLGMTATPRRLDGKGLAPPFDVMHCGLSVAKLIELSRLSRFTVKRVPSGFGRKGLRRVAGEYNSKDLDAGANDLVVGNAVNAYLKYIPGYRTIMFGVTKRHARVTSARLVEAGVRAGYVGDDTDPKERDATFDRFGDGGLDVVCNVGLVDEGFDVPACDAIMDVAPTMSVTKYMQRAGRMLRYQPDKLACLVDLVGNIYEHGSPDVDRHWSLEDSKDLGRPERTGDVGRNLRCCKHCLTVFKPTQPFCPQCGVEHDGRPVSEVDVELIEDTPPPPKPPPEPKMSQRERGLLLRDCHQLHALGRSDEAWTKLRDAARAVGYAPGWAIMLADHIGIPEEVRR